VKKITFWAKKLQKVGFFAVFSTALKRFGILLYDSDDAEFHRMAAQFDAQRVPAIKKPFSEKENCVLFQ